jgi:serine/threonine-protein kinase
MVVHNGLVKITDFGIARMRTNEVKTMTGMILGSPKYMSPEQVAGKRADHRSDLFSLGVVLYEMLTGEAPFQADSIHGIMYQIMQFTPTPPSVRNRLLPDVVDLIVAKALNKGVEERYQDASDFARDLRECRNTLLGLASGPVHATDASRGQPPAPTSTRRTDRLAAVKTAPADPAPEQETKGLTLSKAFDSHEATMRLASLTGAEREMSSQLQKPAPATAPAAAASSTDTWRDPKRSSAPRPQNRASMPSYTYLWIVGGLAIAIALALILLR